MSDSSSNNGAAEMQLSVCSMIMGATTAEQQEPEVVDKEVSSKAIIRPSVQNVPAVFIELEEETNLNVSPPRLCKKEISGSFADVPFKRRSIVDYSSFLMAHKYPEVVGEVDVISDAEHIKKLLKMPFGSDSELSMAVHRIGKTLLLNDFDVPSLLAQLSAKRYGNLNWLRDFYHEALGPPSRSHVTTEDTNKEQVMLQTLLSAYLEHSAAASSEPDLIDYSMEKLSIEKTQPGSELERVFMSKVLSQNEQQSGSSSQQRPEQSFQRDVLWNFEDLTMLVGSNMPIFGGGKYPVVSLRLRDASTPINVLTGLDYWLDNLMCNVPEVVMCFHVKGIVKKYEIVKTEDLPKLEGGKFSPKVIKDIAQNILSFLKANCTKEGHTYWLFKGGKDDVVKLYDLTSICSERTNDTSQNPFTVAVGSLLYRVARNMINAGITSEKNAATIKTLLCNCLLLLNSGKYPELTQSAHLLLADLFLSEVNDMNREELTSSQLQIQELEQYEEELAAYNEEESDAESTSSKTTNNFWNSSVAEQGRIADNMKSLNKEERYRKVIYHVVQAIYCQKESPLLVTMDETLPDVIHPPLKYEATDGPSRSREDSPRHHDTPQIWRSKNSELSSLFSKLAQAYCKLAEVSIRKGKYGRALKFTKIGLGCKGKMQDVKELNQRLLLEAKFLMLVGDVHFFLARCNDDGRLAHKEEFTTLNSDDQYVLDECGEHDMSEIGAGEPFGLHEEKLFLLASDFYERSLELYPDEASDETINEVIDVTGRLGNVRNELGVYYMNCAANCTKGFGNPLVQEQELWKKSYSYLEKGIKAFEVAANKQNIALLYSNAGRLMRLCAHVAANSTKMTADSERGPFNQEEKTYYNKAFEFYQRAFSALGIRSANTDIWDKVTDEISGTYFAMATILQDYTPYGNMSEEQVMKEVLSLMMKALHYCEELSSQEGQMTVHVQKRIGNIHYRIASLYHHWIRHQGSDASNRKYRSLADKHYEKACGYLAPEKFPCDYLRCLVEKNGLRLRTPQQTQNASLILKACTMSLDTIVALSVRTALSVILETLDVAACTTGSAEERHPENESTLSALFLSAFNTDIDDFTSILDVVQIQLCDCLHEILRIYKTKQSSKTACSSSLPSVNAKKMYEIVLRNKSKSVVDDKGENSQVSLKHRCTAISQTIEQLILIRQGTGNLTN